MAVVEVVEPRIWTAPDYVSSAGVEAIELAAMAGLELDDWQQFILTHALGERDDGNWAAPTVGVCVPRQNGKGGIIEARQLTGLYLVGERLQVYSAHLFDTSLEAFRRLSDLIEGRDELSRRVKRISRAHGEEGIELYGPKSRRVTGTQRVRFRTRTKGGGRGFSGDCVYFDEAMIFPEVSHAAILPILSARPNPQAWYLGSAVDQEVHEDGRVFTGVRKRGQRGDERVAYFEHSADFEKPADLEEADLADRGNWAQANPALGIRIMSETVADELESLSTRAFAVERLGVWDAPNLDESADQVIDIKAWDALTDPDSVIVGRVAFAFDVSPDRGTTTISVAGHREDGRPHVEIVDRRAGTNWVPERILELRDAHDPIAILCDAASPAASLIKPLENLGVIVEAINSKDYAAACGGFFDLVVGDEDEGEVRRLRHLGTAELRAAIKGARQRTLGEAWAWSRKSSAVDITPLVSATLALRGVVSEDGDAGFEWASAECPHCGGDIAAVIGAVDYCPHCHGWIGEDEVSG